ncbi:hypothetical protein V2G26_015194 [Clonostachys chloroleuca]
MSYRIEFTALKCFYILSIHDPFSRVVPSQTGLRQNNGYIVCKGDELKLSPNALHFFDSSIRSFASSQRAIHFIMLGSHGNQIMIDLPPTSKFSINNLSSDSKIRMGKIICFLELSESITTPYTGHLAYSNACLEGRKGRCLLQDTGSY